VADLPRRIAIATPDETRATTIGDLVVRARLVEGWQWYPTPAEVAVAYFDGLRPLAIVVDHLHRTETLAAARIIRTVERDEGIVSVRGVPIVCAFNGDHPEDPRPPDRDMPVSAWISRAVFLRDLVEVLKLRGVGRR
jgi:hypothetical protein